MAADFSKAPYYDDYDPSKGYTKILAVPGRVEQAREFTQAQTITQGFIERLGESIYKNGAVIEGCTLFVDAENNANISSGKIFLNGLIRNVDGGTVKVTGVGTEVIGARIRQDVVTEIEDPTLLDPCTNYENYGQAGAHRLKETVVFSAVTEDDMGDSIPVFTLVDGVLPHEDTGTSAQEQYLQETLARRTYDENGSYKVRGLNLIDRREADDEHIYISVSDGKAYVRGFEITKSVAERLTLDKALTARTVSNEAKTYTDRVTYKLSNQPGQKINRANCKIEYTTTLTRGNITGGQDYILNQKEGSVDSITKVWQAGTEYKEGESFQMTGNAIDWSLAGKEPSTGSQYQVTYIYNQVMEQGDFILTHNNYYNLTTTTTLRRDKKGNGRESEQDNLDDFIPLKENQELIKVNKVFKRSDGEGSPKAEGSDYQVTLGKNGTAKIHWVDQGKMDDQADYIVEMVLFVQETDEDNLYIELSPEVSPKPVLGSRMSFDYDFYLSRKDLITIDKNGQYHIYKGIPNVARLVESQVNQDEDQLVIGTVLVYANSSKIILVTDNTTRLSQNQLYNVRKRVENLEYNIAMSDLDKEAMDGENATQLKGVFTDGFLGLSKCDVTHSEFDCSIDLDMHELTLPTQEYVYRADPGSGNGTNIAKVGSVYMAPFEHEKAIEQPYATGSFLVNPYAVYNTMALVQIEPSVDNWIDQDIITVDDNGQQQTTTVGTLRRWWYHRGEPWVEEEKQKWLELTGTTGEQLNWDNFEGERTTTTSEMVLDEAIMYMRQTEVTVHGSNFLPYSDNIECYFNDIKVSLTKVGDTQSGTVAGTVKAKADGTFDAKFTVPKNVQCGTVSVVLKNGNNDGSTTYTAQGRHQIMAQTVVHEKTIVQATDPLAQSFSFSDDSILTRINVYFSAKDSTKNIVLQVRNMVNGYPGTTCYDEEIINNADVKTSENASIATTIDLSQPVYCKANEQYCFTILSDSNEFSMYTATLGETDHFQQKAMTSQPYATGVLFDSSNNMTWTAHQTSDLKFELYRAKYTGKGVIVFDDVNTAQISHVVLAAQSIDYKNAGIFWYYRTSAADPWLPIDTYVANDLSQSTTLMQLRCEMETKYSTSPLLAGDCINLVCFTEKSKGAYVSRRVVMEQDFDEIALSFEAAIPSGTKVTPKYSLDDVSWQEFENQGEPTVTVISDEFNRYEYKKTSLPVGTRNYRVKLEMESENPIVRPRVRRLMSILRQIGE